jgi:26S proteasome regulatory subunit N9
LELFDVFVKPIESHLNPLKVVEIARRVAREYKDPKEALSFLQSVHSRLADPNPQATPEQPLVKPPPRPAAEAYALSLTSIAYAYLVLQEPEKSKENLDKAEKILGDLDSVEPSVNAGLYGVGADYYKYKADYVAFYRSSLLFLACIDVDKDLSAPERLTRAHDLSIAALLGETIYNFGELLQHPILAALDGTELEWVKQMLFVFNAGDIGKYEALVPRLPQLPILENDKDFLRQKICLMALIEAVFRRPRSQRVMSFQTIAQETRLPLHEVEILVMKALSLKLIKGSIDQVNSLADIHWVQPRVLDAEQTQALAQRLDEWCERVGKVEGMVGGYRNESAVAA